MINGYIVEQCHTGFPRLPVKVAVSVKWTNFFSVKAWGLQCNLYLSQVAYFSEYVHTCTWQVGSVCACAAGNTNKMADLQGFSSAEYMGSAEFSMRFKMPVAGLWAHEQAWNAHLLTSMTWTFDDDHLQTSHNNDTFKFFFYIDYYFALYRRLPAWNTKYLRYILEILCSAICQPQTMPLDFPKIASAHSCNF